MTLSSDYWVFKRSDPLAAAKTTFFKLGLIIDDSLWDSSTDKSDTV